MCGTCCLTRCNPGHFASQSIPCMEATRIAVGESNRFSCFAGSTCVRSIRSNILLPCNYLCGCFISALNATGFSVREGKPSRYSRSRQAHLGPCNRSQRQDFMSSRVGHMSTFRNHLPGKSAGATQCDSTACNAWIFSVHGRTVAS